MDCVIIPAEIEFFIQTMQPQDMSRIGTKSWIEWHLRLQKLNQEALLEAAEIKEEYVKETLITFGKIPVLVHEAILINVWKHKLLPVLLQMEKEPENTFVAYSILFHEATCVALLELVLFHPAVAEALDDYAADLLDYACNCSSQLLVIRPKETKSNENMKKNLLKNRDDLSFDIGIRCLTIIRYLAENLDKLPAGLTLRMFEINDIPVLLVQILLERPWLKNGKQYVGGKWISWDGEVIIKAEAQIWLTLRQLLLDPACMTNYPITDSRKSQIIKLQPRMSPILIDQISPLAELQQWLNSLTFGTLPTAPHKPILLETILQIKNAILEKCEGKWKSIAQEQLPNVFSKNKEELLETAKSLNEAFNTDFLEKYEVQDSAISCAKCGNVARQRCSRCKVKWYCSRSCQVEHWTMHQDSCKQAC